MSKSVQEQSSPCLFGLTNSNRDFSLKSSWGKNQFNNSFPTSLACYMYSQELEPVYLTLDKNLSVKHDKISVSTLFGINPLSSNLFFAFESDYVPYRKIVVGKLPRVDLVTINTSNVDSCLKSIEIKLTALPDNSTYQLTENKYGSEIVTRPDTIVYLALSIAEHFQDKRLELLSYFEHSSLKIDDWSRISSVLPVMANLVDSLDRMLVNNLHLQQPLVMQPIWKTLGKTARLSENCLDIFIWSNFAFTRLFIDVTKTCLISKVETINRPMRAVVWLIKMLYDFAITGKINHKLIIDILTYNTKNDKAFALSGRNTRQYMTCAELIHPRIHKNEIKHIILGGGQNFLSPERRFDAVVLSNPEIFD